MKQCVAVANNRIWINNEEVTPIPTKRRHHSITQIDGKIYVDGYEFKNGKWKRTLKAIWHLWF